MRHLYLSTKFINYCNYLRQLLDYLSIKLLENSVANMIASHMKKCNMILRANKCFINYCRSY